MHSPTARYLLADIGGKAHAPRQCLRPDREQIGFLPRQSVMDSAVELSEAAIGKCKRLVVVRRQGFGEEIDACEGPSAGK